MKNIFLLFPNQLFKDVSKLKNADTVYLIEEELFFKQYRFHKQKLVLHRASMRYYQNYLQTQGIKVEYIESINKNADLSNLLISLKLTPYDHIHCYDVCDDWLEQKIKKAGDRFHFIFNEYPSLLFINSKASLSHYFENKQKYFQTDFYITQRKKLHILIDEDGKPQGGQWSFDADNRKKYPNKAVPPTVHFPSMNAYAEEAIDYVNMHYPNNYGMINKAFIFPSTHSESEEWLQQFLEQRFSSFGEYEDAIVDAENILHHSVLTPMLNIGLLEPMQIVNASLAYADVCDIPINSLEGFIRQIIGWREFIRGLYLYKGRTMRTTNFWSFNRNLPPSYYNANTGIDPIDNTIKKVLSTAYNHHIERLMILGNFMLLNELHPDQVYQWFMEMYIDAYDWVMVPNIYGMSQFADGGLMATKPYISGSSYVLKMSNYKKGDWTATWDALFWHFMHKQRSFFLSNPRLSMLIYSYDKMNTEKQQLIQQVAKSYLTDQK